MNANKKNDPVIVCGIGASSVDINGDIIDIPPQIVLARIRMVPDCFGGTRFSRISSHAENMPQAEVTSMKFEM